MKLFLALLLLLLPTLLYVGYMAMRRRSIGGADWWESGPGFWLAIGGFCLLIGGLATWALTSGAPTDSVYVPAHYVDGELIEGHFQSAADADTVSDGGPGVNPADDGAPSPAN